MNEQPPTPLSLNPTLPPDVESFFATLLAKDPDERYLSGAEIVAAFRAAVDIDISGCQPSAAKTIFVSAEQELPETSPTITSLTDTLESIPLLPLSSVLEDVTDTVGDKEHLFGGVVRWWTDRPIVALAFVSLLGVLSAAVMVSVIRSPAILSTLRSTTVSGSTATSDTTQNQGKIEPGLFLLPTSEIAATGAPENANILLVYSDAAMTLINISDDVLSLAEVTFRRIPVRNGSEATFSASIWNQITGQTVENLGAGNCYQLLHFDDTSFTTQPDAIFLATCDSLGSVLVAREEEWTFWMPDGDSTEFQVLRE